MNYQKSWTNPGEGFIKEVALKEDIQLMDLAPRHYNSLKSALEKIEKTVGFSTMEDGKDSLLITKIKDGKKTQKAIRDTLKKLKIREPQDVDYRHNRATQ